MVVVVRLYLTLPHYHNYADVSEGIEILKYVNFIILSSSNRKYDPLAIVKG